MAGQTGRPDEPCWHEGRRPGDRVNCIKSNVRRCDVRVGGYGAVDGSEGKRMVSEGGPSIGAAPHVPPHREKLPRKRKSRTYSFSVSDCRGFVTVGEYEDGRPGEVFIKVSKQGSTLAGIVDALSIAVSLGLQHGVPLGTFVDKYRDMRFEPSGQTDDPEIADANSLVDYIFRRLALDYLARESGGPAGVPSSVLPV